MSLEDVQDALSLSQSVIIEEPQPLRNNKDVPIMQFPISVLPKLMHDAVLGIHDKTQASIEICIQSVLAATNLVVQRYSNVILPWGQVRPISCYFTTIAGSGERKTSCDTEALISVRQYEKMLHDRYIDELRLWKSDYAIWQSNCECVIKGKKRDQDSKNDTLSQLGIEPQKPLLPYLTCTDPTFEGLYKLLINGQPSIGLFSSEGGQFLSGYSMNKDNKVRTAAALSSIWDGSRLDRIRGSDEITSIYNKRLCMHLMIQPEIAKKFFNDNTLVDQGFISRLLVSAPNSSIGKRDISKLVSKGSLYSIEQFKIRMHSILDTALRDNTIFVDDNSDKIWRDFYCYIEKEICEGGELESIRSFAGKAIEHSIRIAATLTLFDDITARYITEQYIIAGVSIVKYYLNEHLRLCNTQTNTIDHEITYAEKLLKWIKEKWQEDYISLPDIYLSSFSRKVRTKREALKVVRILEDHGYLTRVDVPMTVKGCIRRDVWRITNTVNFKN